MDILTIRFFGCLFVPVVYNLLPRHVLTDSIQCGEFRLHGAEEPSMFEADYIPTLRIPTFGKLCCARWRYEFNPIWAVWVSVSVVAGRERERAGGNGNVQQTLPSVIIDWPNDFRLRVSEFLNFPSQPSNILGEGGGEDPTLCFRKPFDLPDSSFAKGSRKMIPSPPSSIMPW